MEDSGQSEPMEHNRRPMQWSCLGLQSLNRWQRLQPLHHMWLLLWIRLHLPHYPTVIHSSTFSFLLQCHLLNQTLNCVHILNLQESLSLGSCWCNSRRVMEFDFPHQSVCFLSSYTWVRLTLSIQSVIFLPFSFRNLALNYLTGALPAAIANLTGLQYL